MPANHRAAAARRQRRANGTFGPSVQPTQPNGIYAMTQPTPISTVVCPHGIRIASFPGYLWTHVSSTGCRPCTASINERARAVEVYNLAGHLAAIEHVTTVPELNLIITEIQSNVGRMWNPGTASYSAWLADLGVTDILDACKKRIGAREAARTARLEADRIAALARETRRLRDLARREADQRSDNAHRTMVGTVEPPAEPASVHTVNRRGGLSCGCLEYESCDCRHHSNEHGRPFLSKPATGLNCRLIGVEVEVNSRPSLATWVNKWRGAIHEDGSCGWEAVTTPISGNHIAPCLRELTGALRSEGNSADERCGVHVHVDARDIRWADMYRLMAVYAKVEPILYLLAGQQRLQQHYCRPCGPLFLRALAQEDRKSAIIAAATLSDEESDGRREAKNRIGKKHGGRYRGLNIIPWLAGRRVNAPDTTVEFRMHRNTLSGERLAGWARLCARLVEWCANATDAEAANLPKSALRALCVVIAPELAPWILRRVSEWRKVTSHDRYNDSDAVGRMPSPRRITMKGGVYSCAV